MRRAARLAVLPLLLVAILAATAQAATRPVTPKQRACLVKSIGAAASRAYVAGKPVKAAWKARIRACLAPAKTPVTPVPPQPACVPALDSTGAYLSEGGNSTDARVNVAAKGTIRATVLFVDFSDAPGSDAPASIAGGWMAAGTQWLQTSSYGRVSVQLQPALQWFRMPKPASAYGFARGLSYDAHRGYVADAIAAADSAVDFSKTDIVYVVAARTSQIGFSPTLRAAPGTFTADGRSLGPAVTFGLDAYTYGRTILPHETGHLFGLPDLYSFASGGHPFVGTWDLMGNVFQATDLTAWHRYRLGWLDASQFACAGAGKSTDATLTPLGSSGGVKAVFAKTGGTTAVVVENRQAVANDASVCDAGALVYTVDSTVATGAGPVTVAGGDAAGNGCGYGNRSDAPLHVGESVTVAGVTVAVTGGSGDALAVKVTVP